MFDALVILHISSPSRLLWLSHTAARGPCAVPCQELDVQSSIRHIISVPNLCY